MLQQSGLCDLMQYLRLQDGAYRFEVETNGTLIPTIEFDALIDQYNVSPKLANSNNPQKLREKAAVFRFFARSEKANFKFVVSEKIDLEEVMALIARYEITHEKVWLMPEGTTAAALARRRKWLVEVCKSEGFRFSDRLHIQIWGSKKGV